MEVLCIVGMVVRCNGINVLLRKVGWKVKNRTEEFDGTSSIVGTREVGRGEITGNRVISWDEFD